MAGHRPRVTIQAPANGSLLPAGPWELTVSVEDWPLADAGPLGIGPHLVLQLDGEPAIRVTSNTLPIKVSMPQLGPGSHRLTAYAAFPWGEALKQPGASQQITLHRVAPNPLSLPAEGSPQLIPVPAARASSGQPVLIDWLLLGAPLQHLRDGDDSWRLRVTVNGDSFLLDRQAPLWLQGLHNGSNAIVLELLDQVGQPLNPPFNSVVQELELTADPLRGWQLGQLADDDLQRLLGVATAGPAELEPSPSPATPAAENLPAPPGSEPALPVEAAPLPPLAPPASLDSPASSPPEEPAAQQPGPAAASPAAPITEPAQPMSLPLTAAPPDQPPTPATTSASAPEPSAEASEPATAPWPEASLDQAPPRPRDLVNPDGTLVMPPSEGPLGRLRARFAR
ncbi:hypothetical protein KBY88_12725 [Cyanobium sp. Morenito 9A2]|nr:hypothetical protein [Cyanobium sp. Morenito 9A2]